MKILVIDDDEFLAGTLREALLTENFTVRVGYTAEECLREARDWQPDLILLDIMLPGGMTGLEALRLLRRVSDVPVILITAKDDEADKVLGLEYADDYLVKPFGIQEMLARVRARLRRPHPAGSLSSIINIGDLNIDLDTRQVSFSGRQIELTPTEYRILVVLATFSVRVVTREELVSQVWGDKEHVERHTLDVHVNSLRRKLEPSPAHTRHVRTIRGIGFRYVA